MAKKIKNGSVSRKAPVKSAKGAKVKNSGDVSAGMLANIFGGNYPGGSALSQVNTVFANNRNYLVSNLRTLISDTYYQHGVIQTIIDVPVDDGLRGGIDIKTKQLEPAQIEELIGELDRQNDLVNIGWGLKWTRLFGGGGVVIVTDQDPATPFDIESIDEDTPLKFRPFDLWELYNTNQTNLAYDDVFQEQEYYNFYGVQLHHSRVLVMKGQPAPSFVRPRLRGWGLSTLESIIRSLNQYLKANDLTFEVLDEFKLDVFKFENLANVLLSRTGGQDTVDRVTMANQQKNYQNAIILDKNDDYDHKQLSFAGLAEVAAGIRMQLACDLRMPISKIFGVSSTGFSSGEDDIENYNGMVESQVRQKAKYDILRVVEIRCQQRFGMVPDDLQIGFKPLRMLSAEQEENVKTQKFNRLFQAKSAGDITMEEFRDACNKDQLLGIQLEKEVGLQLEREQEADKQVAMDAGGGDGGGKKVTPPPFKGVDKSPEAKS